MPIVLCRVDDRLIHGQVVIGWGRPLGVELIVLVDDEVAASPWEQELYRMAVPPEIEVAFATRGRGGAAAGRVAGGRRERGLVLTGDLETMAALHRADARGACSGSTSAAFTTGPAGASGCRIST